MVSASAQVSGDYLGGMGGVTPRQCLGLKHAMGDRHTVALEQRVCLSASRVSEFMVRVGLSVQCMGFWGLAGADAGALQVIHLMQGSGAGKSDRQSISHSINQRLTPDTLENYGQIRSRGAKKTPHHKSDQTH